MVIQIEGTLKTLSIGRVGNKTILLAIEGGPGQAIKAIRMSTSEAKILAFALREEASKPE